MRTAERGTTVPATRRSVPTVRALLARSTVQPVGSEERPVATASDGIRFYRSIGAAIRVATVPSAPEIPAGLRPSIEATPQPERSDAEFPVGHARQGFEIRDGFTRGITDDIVSLPTNRISGRRDRVHRTAHVHSRVPSPTRHSRSRAVARPSTSYSSFTASLECVCPSRISSSPASMALRSARSKFGCLIASRSTSRTNSLRLL